MKNFEFTDLKKYLISIKYNIFPNDVSEETLFSSMDLNSMDMIEVFYMIEQDYGINIPFNIIEKNDTIQQLIDKLNKILTEK